MKKEPMPVYGVWLRGKSNRAVEVLVEVQVGGEKKWVPIIEEAVESIGGVISHITEPAGIQSRIDHGDFDNLTEDNANG